MAQVCEVLNACGIDIGERSLRIFLNTVASGPTNSDQPRKSAMRTELTECVL